ncbi:hypothetical protein VHA01S_054_00100 [Vibrio halioticoli NBRC 102217]|uniref:Uncharacterized protein n=1 Tax=Vibrio halioticoli NBRC 102217 TaxID=1219072 RepID=V5FM26_9VIBR|nr:hypothetical protein [Vibrio halioticoli]GAD90716.1 hypothetical protein VHA01S_054_00100 [Vibrio halioticoli NBRC 102217]
MKSLWKALGVLGVIVITIFAGGIGKVIGKLETDNFFDGEHDAQIESGLKQISEEVNKQLPMMIDAETRLDTTFAIKRKVVYKYTLVKYEAKDIDSSIFQNNMWPQLINNYCTSKEMSFFVKNNIEATYSYYGKNGKQLSNIKIDNSQCKSSS